MTSPPDAAIITVGWIAPMPLELTPAVALLEQHATKAILGDDAQYHVGRIGDHWVAMAICHRIGTNSTATVLANMRRSFPNIKHILVVGIAGGMPSYGPTEEQIVLGDVVVGYPQWSEGGVAHHESGAYEERAQLAHSEGIPHPSSELAHSGHMLHPSPALLTAVNNLRADHMTEPGTRIPQLLHELRAGLTTEERLEFDDPGAEQDNLFPDDYLHPNRDLLCRGLCELDRSRRRSDRGSKAEREKDRPRIHYGTIASANSLIVSTTKRNDLYKKHGAICFEMEAAGVMGDYQALVIRGICDYADSHKNKQWQKYAAATAAACAKEILLLVPPTVIPDKRGEEQQDEQTRKCLSDLRLTDPRDDMRRIADTKGGLFPAASNWILSSDGFRRWRDTDHARLLWIKGDPGKGKTMLMITIVEELERQRRTTSLTVLSYFFCQGTDENLNHATAVLRGLIYILCEQQPWLASHLRARYDHADAKLFQDPNSFYALSKVLESILEDERLQSAYLVVDALDECMSGQDQLLRFIGSYGRASPRVKWIVSSRNISNIENLLKIDSSDGSPGSEVKLSLEVTQNADQVALAVNAFIDHKLSTMGPLRDDYETRSQVRDILREKANGTFLWVALVIDELLKTDSWDMLEVLEELPETLEDLYDRMIQQIRNLKRRNPEFCRLVLSAATLAYRPLHLTELAIVSGLPTEISDHANLVQEVIGKCGSFLTVKERVVYLIHQSVKDYLSGRASDIIFPSGPSQVHRTMFARSVEALSTGRLRRNIYDLQHLGTTIDDIEVPKPDPLAAVRYSCIHWARHFCDISSGNSGSETKDLERIDRFIRSVFLYWLEAAALLQRMSECIIAIRQLETSLKAQSCEGCVMNLISDAVRFALHNRYTIENAPLQAYVSALIFSPLNSLIRQEFSKEEPTWVNPKPIIETSWGACAQTLEGHSASVHSVAFSPDGRQIVSGSDDHTIKIWDRESGACVQTLKGSSCVLSVAFSPDGRQIVSGSDTIQIWDCKLGVCMQTLKGHSDSVYSVAFSPDGQQIISGSGDTIQIWDCKLGVCMQTLKGHSDSVCSVTFSPDGQQIISGSADGDIKIWDCKSGACMQTLERHSGSGYSVAFSPDGQQIISSSGNTIKIWDRKSGACVQTLHGHSDAFFSCTVCSVAFSPDGQQIISGSHDSTIKIWDCKSGACMQTLKGHSDFVCSVAFSPDGQQIVSGSCDHTIKVWDCKSGVYIQTLEGHSDPVKSVVFSPDGQQIISISDEDTIMIWDCKSGACVRTLEDYSLLFPVIVCSVAFSPDGQQIISGSDESTIKIWDRKSGACVQTLEDYNHIFFSAIVCSVAFSPDGQQIISGSGDTIQIWDCKLGVCMQTLKGHSDSVCSVTFSPDGQQIISGSVDGDIKIWDCKSGACMQTLKGHSSSVHSVAFSPDGRRIVSGSGDRTIRVWDRESGACAQTFKCKDGGNYVVAVEASSTSYLRVLTNRGWIGLATGQGLPRRSTRSVTDREHTTGGEDDEYGYESGYRYGYGLSTDHRWICRREQNVLWLPPGYRPSSSAVWCPRHALTTSDGSLESTVALGCPSGRVIVLGLADDGSPCR